jgi:sulfoxide reductase heme-binding subunit YedZ
MISERMRRRLLRRHLPLAFVAALALGAQFAFSGLEDPRLNWSLGTGYAALALIAVTLILGPALRRTRGRSPLSFDLRRDVGVWAGGLALVHVVFGLQAHMSGRIWLYFVPESFPEPPVRLDLFGFANDTGLAATVVVAVLLAISSDAALRALGPERWKWWQRWNYAGFALTVIHAAAYQVVEKRAAGFVLLLVLAAAAALAGRALDLRARPLGTAGPMR